MDTAQIIVLAVGAAIVMLILIFMGVMWVRNCCCKESTEESTDSDYATENIPYPPGYFEEKFPDGSERKGVRLPENVTEPEKDEKDENGSETGNDAENENGADSMTQNCPELEKKYEELKAELEELKAEKKAAEEAAEKKAQAEADALAIREEIKNFNEEAEKKKYEPTPEQIAKDIEENKAAEVDANVAKIYARMMELYGDEIAQLSAGKQELTGEELIKLVEENPELLDVLIAQFRNKCINEKVEPVVKTVTRIASEHYDEEERKRKQEYSDAVDGAICKELCPKNDDAAGDQSVADDQPAVAQ